MIRNSFRRLPPARGTLRVEVLSLLVGTALLANACSSVRDYRPVDGGPDARVDMATTGSGGSAARSGGGGGPGTGGAVAGTGGAPGSGGGGGGTASGGATGTGGAAATGGAGGAASGTGGAPATGGNGGAAGRVGTGGGGAPGTGGAATGGRGTGGASTGGASSGGAPGTGGAATGGRGTGGASTGGASSGGAPGTGGAPVTCNPGYFGAACNYYFVGLGYPSPSHSTSEANAISGDGTTVVGATRSSSTNQVAFRWQNGVIQSLGLAAGTDTSIAFATNATGSRVAGTSYAGNETFAFEWVMGGSIASLPRAEFGTRAEAHGMSADGTMIVGYGDNDGESRSFRWINGGITIRGAVDPTYEHAISADKSVIGGWIVNAPMKMVGTTAMPGTTVTPQQTLTNYPTGRVLALNATGSVAVGYLQATAGGTTLAVRWNGMAPPPQDLGALASATFNRAYATNAAGDVVVGASGGVAFIWDGTMRSLATVLTQAGVNLTNWTLSAATAISSNGKVIAGNGAHGSLTESWIVRLP